MLKFRERKNKIILHYNKRIEKLTNEKTQALTKFNEVIAQEAGDVLIICAYCSKGSCAHLWKFHQEHEYSECAHYGEWSTPIPGWVKKSTLQSSIACPLCMRKAIISEHSQRDVIIEILDYTSVIEKH